MNTKIKNVIGVLSAILIIGGFFIFSIPKSFAASDDPTWTTSIHTLPAALDSATSVTVGNKIYLMGGEDSQGNIQNTVYIGTIGADDDVTWANSANTLPTRGYSMTGVVSDNNIYLMGGYSVENNNRIALDSVLIGAIGNDGDVTWTTSAHTLPKAPGATTGVLSNKNIYLMGGEGCENNNCSNFDTVYIGTIGGDGDVSWTTSSHTLPENLAWSTSVHSGNKIYVMGGNTTGGVETDAVYIGTIGNDGDVTWVTSANTIPKEMDAVTGVFSDSKIYVLGGEVIDNNNWSVINTVYIGTIGNDGDVTWATSANTLPAPSGYATSIIYGNKIYVMGGVNDDANWIDTDAVYIGTLPQDSSTSDHSSNDPKPQKASISSWKASQYTDQSKCAARMLVTIKGKHFHKDATVKINGKEATSVKVKNSENITANFCLTKLLDNQASRKRNLTVTNPDADTETADKQINLKYINYDLTTTDLDPTTTIGITNIQKALVQLGLLDKQYITGIYGPITTNAVKTFQLENGLPQTGTVGPLTKAKLREKG